MVSRLVPYLAYFSSSHPVDEHGTMPVVLVAFEDALAEARFLGVAREETERTRVQVPLWVSHRDALEQAGPLGPVWRTLGEEGLRGP